MSDILLLMARQSNHVNSICSTWGREHFKTFDGDVYQFPGTCEYNLASDCHSESYQEFSVHLKRNEATETEGNPTVKHVVVTINDLVFHLTKTQVAVNGEIVTLPYYNGGVQLERNAVYTKLYSKVGLVVMWNGEDAVMVELDMEYTNRTCGLCGDFNGLPVHSEFIHDGRKVSPIEFGNRQKVHRPNEDCEDPYEEEEEDEPADVQPKEDTCKEFHAQCDQLLRSALWSSCGAVVNPEPYIQACVQDLCGCSNTSDSFCVCSTLAEYSRQCSHAGGQPPHWRTTAFCDKQCPFNMVYLESGSPCMDTCTHSDTSSLCEEHLMDGCFCPHGTVFDDISKRGCVTQDQCQCKHDKVYNSGEVFRQDREECVCHHGQWSCKSLPSPGTCAVEEGSHVTTFDGKAFTFHGDCYYPLAKVESKDEASPKFTVLVQLVPCIRQKFDTCLKSVVVLLNNDRNNALVITADGKVSHNAQITLPYNTADISVFKPSSFHMILQTSFGLQVQIQLVPIMQVYVTLDESYKTKTQGLCGNFNKVLSDDMKTPQGMVEGTASSFGNSWKANPTCRDREERLDDPCSLSVENENYAKHWCSMLRSSDSTFAKCHAMVDPELYYKRCTYASCNCEKSEDCLCAVFSSYVRDCATKGVVLSGWRENVCDKYTGNCPASQTYSDQLQRCQLTCSSLASKRQGCTNDFLPVDGCSCPDGLYMDDRGTCVPMDKCPCFHNGVHIKPGKSINIQEEHCVCNNGKLHCRSWKMRSESTCQSPKVFLNCSNDLGVQCTRSCRNPDFMDCFSAECESGCKCPMSLWEDGKGMCVKKHECPCSHDGFLYAPGKQIPNGCNTCTCKSGKWECTDKKCPGTCTIYGSGHYKTFDERTYGFQGKCGYVAVQNKCGNRPVQDNFMVITENIPCGTTGTTCSKSVRVQLGRTELKLSKGTYEVVNLGVGSQIQYRVRTVGLYLTVESDIGIAVLWDRKTTVRIVLEPQHSGAVCGLCGNYNGDGRDDFTTQGQLIVSSPVDFANSWKVSSTCPDAESNVDPCGARPNRHNWAKMQCSIITGKTFQLCHKKVDPTLYFENCVKDSCACDTGGDCECFCTAVAAYAQACTEAGVCVAWRTPEICPVFCDYYNDPGECEWHYSPCHTPCYKTCLNLNGTCDNPLPNLEGCYPGCPPKTPIFDEETGECVEISKTTTPIPPTTTTTLTTTPTPPPTTTPTTTPIPPTTTTPIPPTTTPTIPTMTTTQKPTTPKPTTPPTPPTTTPSPPTTTKPPTTTTPIPPPTTTPIPPTTTTPIPPPTTTTPVTTPIPPTTTTTSTPTTTTPIPPTSTTPISTKTTTPIPPTTTTTPTPPTTTTPIPPTTTTPSPSPPTTTTPIPPTSTTPKPTTTTTPTPPTTTTPSPPTTTTPIPPTTTTPATTPIPPTTTTTSTPTTTTPIPPTSTTQISTKTTTPIPPTTTTTPTPPTTTTPTTTPIPPTTTTTPATTPIPPTTTTTSTPTTTTPIPPTSTTAISTKTTTPIPPTTTTTPTPPTTTTPTTTPIPPTTTTPSPPTTTTPIPPTSTTPTPPTTTTPTPPTTTTPIPPTTTTTPATTPIPTTTTSTPTTTTTPTTTPIPPTTTPQNETFWLCNCTLARCIENNTIEIISYECPEPEPITCTNGKKPVLQWDEFYCCQHYVCDCVCEGWGDPHYITFDGLFYSFQGNCTYVLMEEMWPRHQFKIYIDNVNCDPTEDVSCPRAIIVSYRSTVITLKNHNLIGAAQLEALIDGVSLRLPFTRHGVKVMNSGINMVLEIAHLQVVVTFGVTGFSVNLPWQHFGNNTQGHCGTCSNNQADDCMLPGGQLVENCAVMADYWPAKDISKPDCHVPPGIPTNSPLPEPTQKPCKPDSSVCDLLKDSIFAACHPFVSPDNFYKGCVYDSCHVSNPAVECTSLQTYAAACAQFGVCIYWRNHTELCASDCPADKVYKPCGPAEQPTCDDNPDESRMNFTTEGCFCPDGMKLFNKESGICVDKCGCLDPEGVPREFNERFEYKCQDCVCLESTKAVTCKPKVCSKPPVEICTGPGFVYVNQTDPSDPCCSSLVCRCDSSTCPPTNMNCPIGFVPVVSVPEGKCCPEHTCEPKRVCLHKGVEYLPNSKVPGSECQECTCTNKVDPKSGHYQIDCGFMQCDKDCEKGYEYQEPDYSSDDCCGKCVQTHCVLQINGTKQLLKHGDTWSAPGDKCQQYSCVKNGDNYLTQSSNIHCPPFQQANCQPGSIQTAANGCCRICVEKDKACKRGSMKSFINHKNCQSIEEVEMPYCEGSCNTFTKYSAMAASLDHSCACCQESRSSNRTVDLQCLNGDVVPYTYLHVEECNCRHSDCHRAIRVPVRKTRSNTLV
ncbi:mucin-2-like [Salvelinus namaycush]|uniref:Mucin-2-like n=1 Tax=Salvelinus namaycush TaxID=8040 RepID=A0A8U0UK01_SALNM|nr:mucin-2-like [Salvelinus namaycush]